MPSSTPRRAGRELSGLGHRCPHCAPVRDPGLRGDTDATAHCCSTSCSIGAAGSRSRCQSSCWRLADGSTYRSRAWACPGTSSCVTPRTTTCSSIRSTGCSSTGLAARRCSPSSTAPRASSSPSSSSRSGPGRRWPGCSPTSSDRSSGAATGPGRWWVAVPTGAAGHHRHRPAPAGGDAGRQRPVRLRSPGAGRHRRGGHRGFATIAATRCAPSSTGAAPGRGNPSGAA